MNNHYFSETGAYTESAPANPGALPPANALRSEPEKRQGFWPVVNAARDGWDYVEDHRGEEGFVKGVREVITVLGPLPEGWSVTAPEPESPAGDRGNAKAEPAAAASGTATAAVKNPLLAEFSDLVCLEGAEERFLLTKRGTYHTAACRFRHMAGEWLTREKICQANPAAKPCGICRPNGRNAP